jgi:hypothetical protein
MFEPSLSSEAQPMHKEMSSTTEIPMFLRYSPAGVHEEVLIARADYVRFADYGRLHNGYVVDIPDWRREEWVESHYLRRLAKEIELHTKRPTGRVIQGTYTFRLEPIASAIIAVTMLLMLTPSACAVSFV